MPELFAPEAFLGGEIERMKSSGSEERGAIYTRREVVDFMLTLSGYTEDRALWRLRMLEPSCGTGDFLLPAIGRLLVAAKRDGVRAAQLHDAITAVELHRDSFLSVRASVVRLLEEHGFSNGEAEALAEAWLINGDFLLQPLRPGFDLVAGNPPYVRQEMIPATLLAEYRRRFATLYDRADLYVPFMEQSLTLLSRGGMLTFICSNRWMKNKYGGPLRRMISRDFSLRYYIDMVGTPAFHSEVIAYPAITVIQRGPGCILRMAHRPEISAQSLTRLHRLLTGPASQFDNTVIEADPVARGPEPWLLEADTLPSLALVRRLESAFPTIEEAGCSIGIGVATGADRVFIGPMTELDVEDERKIPLAMTRDILDGTVQWRGLGVVNPFEEDGTLASFSRYPRFAAYLEKHAGALKSRHCARRAAGSWYRTIDRITPSLARTPKLLIPDIKGGAHVVLETGRLYPHHNLYYLTSREWPLAALQAVLMTGIAHLFVRAYSTKMHGDCLRFQAQYIRRIRLPHWREVPHADRIILAANLDAALVRDSVCRIYQLTAADRIHLIAATSN